MISISSTSTIIILTFTAIVLATTIPAGLGSTKVVRPSVRFARFDGQLKLVVLSSRQETSSKEKIPVVKELFDDEKAWQREMAHLI